MVVHTRAVHKLDGRHLNMSNDPGYNGNKICRVAGDQTVVVDWSPMRIESLFCMGSSAASRGRFRGRDKYDACARCELE